MKWNFFSLETMFKRIFRYLLKRYLGVYFEDFSLDELTYGLSHGKGSVENVKLNIEALNELSEEYNLPVEFLHGQIDFVSFQVPYTALLSENILIELKGVRLIVQPKERPEDVSMFDSMWGSMTSSLQLAEECMNSKSEDDEEFDISDKSEGLEKIAKTIDTVLANMKIRFYDFSLKMEHVPGIGPAGVALEVKISKAEYFDEAGVNTPTSENQSFGNEKVSFEPQAYSLKKVIFEGVSLFTAQFSALSRAMFSSKPIFTSDPMDPASFVPGSPEMPPTHSSLLGKRAEPDVEDEPVLISRLTGQQELRLKLKQNEAIIGPKVDVEFNLGAFNLFLIPQQVHMLYILLSGLMKPSSKASGTKKIPLSVANKPLKPSDYVLVEQELLRQQNKTDPASKSLKNHRGWSSHDLEESDDDFQLMAMENTRFASEYPTSPLNDNDSMCSSICSDTKSVSSGGFPGGNQKSSRTRSSTVQALLQDQVSELTHFRGCCSSFCIIILHDDSVHESMGKGSLDSTNVNKHLSLKERAEHFFQNLMTLQMSGCDFKNFALTRGPLSKLCETNHLRLMASSISIDGNEKSSSAQYIINFGLTLFQFEVVECLFNTASLSAKPQDPTYVEILVGDNKSGLEECSEIQEASFKLKYQQVEYTTQSRSIKPPASKLDIHFGNLRCELDISLTDRIQTLLDFQNLFGQTDSKNDWRDSDVVTVSKCSSKTEINISSPNLTTRLRFPIPDLRSVHDRDRVPWWQQNLHKETLVMELKDATFATTLDSDESQAKFVIQCRDFHGLLQFSDVEEPISFVRVSVDPDVDEISQDGGFDWPRLVIHQTTKTTLGDLEAGLNDEEEMFSYSMSDVLMSNLDTEPTPFCSTPIAYGSKLPDLSSSPKKDDKANPSIDHDEVVKPADKQTILNFIEQTVNKSEYLLEFSLPTANMVFPTKDFFEVLYNRLFCDLLLWQKTALAPKNSYDPSGFKVHIPGLDLHTMTKDPVFRPLPNDYNSDSDEEENNFCSVYEYCQRQKQKHKKKNNNAFTKLSLSLNITKGMLSLTTPFLDETNSALPDICGKMQLYIEDGQLFLASSYKGDGLESYLCFLAEKSVLYHKGSALYEVNAPVVQPFSNRMQTSLNCIIYNSEPGMHLKVSASDKRKYSDMLKVAVHVVNSPKQQLKSFKIAIDISNATLRHYMHSMPQLWINQFIDFLKVKDFPINGYIPSAVVTEFHLNLSNCAIDYRPLKLPLLSAVTVENFNMSCNIAVNTRSFLFRIISEELRIFISNSMNAKKVDLAKNYVCVVDTGLIDISFRTTVIDKDESKIELCATNNIINIRTCADSFKALMELMIYFSMNGDMVEEAPKEPQHVAETQSGSNKVDTENLNLLMAEAMIDCAGDKVLDHDTEKDENKNSDGEQINTDDEFCILEDDPGLGLIPRNGEPQIRMLTSQPIEIVENHFSVPPGKSDVLKAPKHYPQPLVVVALREMSLVWHLYGGNDFKSSGKKNNSRKRTNSTKGEGGVTFSDEKQVGINSNKSTVSFCNVTPLTKEFDLDSIQYTLEHVTIEHKKEPNNESSFLTRGGPGRDHAVLMELQMNKVQFQREIYPTDNKYASRYILLINDVEVRDRLESSEINKFLYQYSSKKIPRQSNANMIDVKAVYTRPDPKCASEECSLSVSCKPLRLNVDQDALIFLIDFFQEIIGVSSEGNSDESDAGTSGGKAFNTPCPETTHVPKKRTLSAEIETFYRAFTFLPDVLIRIDYQGKRVLMEQGALYGLMMGLGQLNSSEIRLKKLCYRNGLLGHHRVLSYAINEWQQDILKNQLPSLLSGVGPMNSFVQLFQGIKDLFYLPVAQYKKDGQIVRGLQRGASSFSTSTAMAFLDLASRLIGAIQGAAIVGCDMVSPGPSVACKFQLTQEAHRQTSQPADIREGIATACNVIKEGLGDTARAIYSVAYNEHEHKGVPGAVGGVLRQIPPSLFKPIILGSEATNHVLDGMRHQLMPDAHQEDLHKWRTKNS